MNGESDGRSELNGLIASANRTGPARRALLLGVGAAGAVAVLTGCGGNSTDPSVTEPGSDATPTGQHELPHAVDGNDLGPTSAIPLGGGKIFPNQLVVVTQPSAGKFKAFTAICSHMQCTVGSIEHGQIVCPCHGSHYSIVDGSVQHGPAPAALTTKPITVANGEITLS